jgi:hypothetical protein
MDIWEELGIDPTSDARTVRRAYAVKLKTIDQATEPERFQRLRAAYTWALARIEHGQSAGSDPAPSEADLPPPPENFHEAFDDTARSSAYADASAAYAKVLEVAANATTRELSDHLRAALDGLVNLEAREELELLVLNDMFAPRGFRERLMIAATEAFDWHGSERHLANRSPGAARELHVWLEERALLHAAVQAGELKIEQPLNWATYYFNNRGQPVPPAVESQVVETMQLMLATFPTVLRYRLDREIVEYWVSRPPLAGSDDTLNAGLRNRPPAKPPPERSSSGRGWGTAVLFALFISSISHLSTRNQAPPIPLAPESGESCVDLFLLEGRQTPLTSKQQRILAECRATLRQGLNGPGAPSGLGLKPPKSLQEPQAR